MTPRASAEVGMSEEQLHAIRERAEKATPGPWASMTFWPEIIVQAHQRDAKRGASVFPDQDAAYARQIASVCAEKHEGEYDRSKFPHRRYTDDPNVIADIAFIAHAREDIPALLAALDAVRAERRVLNAKLLELYGVSVDALLD